MFLDDENTEETPVASDAGADTTSDDGAAIPADETPAVEPTAE